MYILSRFLQNNEECASCNVYGIMRSVHPVNLPGECILNTEVGALAGVCNSLL